MSTQLNQAPVEDDLLELLDRTASAGGADDLFRDAFREACRVDAELHDGQVHPSRVNQRLRAVLGDQFNPRQLSGAWSWASSRNGFLDNTEDPAPIDPSVSKGNGNKTVTLRRWRDAA